VTKSLAEKFTHRVEPTTIQANSTSHWVGAGFKHDTGRRRSQRATRFREGFSVEAKTCGGPTGEYERIMRDPIFNQQRAWAFHTTFSAVCSYSGAHTFYTRRFPADEFVRGLAPPFRFLHNARVMAARNSAISASSCSLCFITFLLLRGISCGNRVVRSSPSRMSRS
jgi:hypothetical protein